MTVIESDVKVIKQNSLDFHLRLEIAGADLIIEDMDIDVEFVKKMLEDNVPPYQNRPKDLENIGDKNVFHRL